LAKRKRERTLQPLEAVCRADTGTIDSCSCFVGCGRRKICAGDGKKKERKGDEPEIAKIHLRGR
jgi:hypothetical protein